MLQCMVADPDLCYSKGLANFHRKLTFGIELDEFSLDDFSTKNTFPTLAMVKGGFHGDSHHNILDTGQVLRIQGVHKEERVLGRLLSDPAKCFGWDGSDMVLSLPVMCDISMFVIKKNKLAKKSALLKTILAENKLPVDIQLSITSNVNCKHRLRDKRLPLSGDIQIKLYEIQNVKYLYGNPVNEGQLHRNIFSIPTHVVEAMLSLVTGLIDGNDDFYHSIIDSMEYTVNTYIDFEGRIGCKDISIVQKGGQRQNKDNTEKNTVQKYQKETGNETHVYEKTSPVILDDHVYDEIKGDVRKLGLNRASETLHQTLAKLRGKPDTTLTTQEESDRKDRFVPKFIRKRINHDQHWMRPTGATDSGTYEPVEILQTLDAIHQRKLPDVPQKVSEYLNNAAPETHKTLINVTVSSTDASKKKTEIPLKILRKISSASDVQTLSVQDLGQYLEVLKLDRHVDKFAESLVDGHLLQDLDEKVLQEEFGFSRFEAIKLCKFSRTGYLPNVSDYSYL